MHGPTLRSLPSEKTDPSYSENDVRSAVTVCEVDTIDHRGLMSMWDRTDNADVRQQDNETAKTKPSYA